MLNRLSTFILLASSMLVASESHGNFVVVNHSSETIVVSVLTTEIFKDGHVNQFETISLGPGQKYDFITNDVVPGRTVAVSIFSKQYGKDYFSRFNSGWVKTWARHRGVISQIPYWNKKMKKLGNHYVASNAANGNYTPLVNSYGGAKAISGLRIVPTQGGHKAFKLTYNGFKNGFGTASW